MEFLEWMAMGIDEVEVEYSTDHNEWEYEWVMDIDSKKIIQQFYFGRYIQYIYWMNPLL